MIPQPFPKITFCYVVTYALTLPLAWYSILNKCFAYTKITIVRSQLCTFATLLVPKHWLVKCHAERYFWNEMLLIKKKKNHQKKCFHLQTFQLNLQLSNDEIIGFLLVLLLKAVRWPIVVNVCQFGLLWIVVSLAIIPHLLFYITCKIMKRTILV